MRRAISCDLLPPWSCDRISVKLQLTGKSRLTFQLKQSRSTTKNGEHQQYLPIKFLRFRSLWGALRSVLPEHGLQGPYTKDPGTYQWIRKILALPLLVHKEIVRVRSTSSWNRGRVTPEVVFKTVWTNSLYDNIGQGIATHLITEITHLSTGQPNQRFLFDRWSVILAVPPYCSGLGS